MRNLNLILACGVPSMKAMIDEAWLNLPGVLKISKPPTVTAIHIHSVIMQKSDSSLIAILQPASFRSTAKQSPLFQSRGSRERLQSKRNTKTNRSVFWASKTENKKEKWGWERSWRTLKGMSFYRKGKPEWESSQKWEDPLTICHIKYLKEIL